MLKRRSRALCVAVGVARTAHKLQALRGLATLAAGCRLAAMQTLAVETAVAVNVMLHLGYPSSGLEGTRGWPR